jgi:hypothetical protein
MANLLPGWSATRLAYALQHPGYAFRVVARTLLQADERTLAKLAGGSRADIAGYLCEPPCDEAFSRHLREYEREADAASNTCPPRKRGYWYIYAAIRAAKPDLVVETSVRHGVLRKGRAW